MVDAPLTPQQHDAELLVLYSCCAKRGGIPTKEVVSVQHLDVCLVDKRGTYIELPQHPHKRGDRIVGSLLYPLQGPPGVNVAAVGLWKSLGKKSIFCDGTSSMVYLAFSSSVISVNKLIC